MSINEVSKNVESGQSAAPGQSLSTDIFDAMVKSYKNGKTTPDTPSDAPAATSKPEPVDNTEELAKAGKLAVEKKGGEHCRLLAAVDFADNNLADNPLIHKQIAKLDLQAMQLQKQSWAQETNIRDTVKDTFTKTDMRELSALGPNPFDQWNKKLVPFEFNNAQRAWLKENHPDVYKMLEKHDRTSLEMSRVDESTRQLIETRDAPINARVDLARYLHQNGMDADAINTLTEAVRKNPSVATRQNKGDEFRSIAIETGAAFDPAFRKAIEANGGNILDFVQRPMQNFGIKEIHRKVPMDFNPEAVDK